jgi:hypothetical protein
LKGQGLWLFLISFLTENHPVEKTPRPNWERTVKRLLTAILFVLFFGTAAIFAQTRPNSGPPPTPPRDLVEEIIWNMAISGELLTAAGWDRASGYYIQPGPVPKDRSFDVISNNCGFSGESKMGDSAEVDMGFTDAGRIDSTLRYSPPLPARNYKTEMVFRLVLTPSYIRNFGPDGKELERKTTSGSIWKIEGPLKRWTTVNTAIRYVLEMRNKSNDPVIKKNADETIGQLLKWH